MKRASIPGVIAMDLIDPCVQKIKLEFFAGILFRSNQMI